MKKKMYSRVIVSGIIINTELNSDIIGITRPVAEITIYDVVKQEWINNIYLIFSDNSSARRFRGFNVGMILLVSGELIYYSNVGSAIYVKDYIILEKNKDKQSVNIQKVFYFDNIGVQNDVFIKGEVVYQNKEKEIISICHDIQGEIRGELDKKSIQPVHVTNKIRDDAKDIVFIGRFSSNMLEGEMYETISV